MKLNRKIPPAVRNVTSIKIPPVDHHILPNGVRLAEVNLGTQDILKMEIVHIAGRVIEDQKLAGRATALLLREGSKSMNSAMVAEHIDFYGSSIKAASNMDFSYSTIYTLNKHFESIIPVISEMYSAPLFALDELEKFKKTNKQKLIEELSKNDVLTYRQITSEVFGKDHAYGYNSEVEDYDALNRSALLNHYEKYYGSDNCYIFISGKTNDKVLKIIGEQFGQIVKPATLKPYAPVTLKPQHSRVMLKSCNQHQSAIKIGRRLFNRQHPDHAAFFLLNTILGGYFGSRLMTSIREKFGYTYDIFSSMDQMYHDGCFYISTEVSPDYVDKTIVEIYNQIQKLQQDKVSDTELNMIKNYIMGNFLNYLDGPLNVSAFIRSIMLNGVSESEFLLFIDELNSITADQIMDVAQKYLSKSQMVEIVLHPE